MSNIRSEQRILVDDTLTPTRRKSGRAVFSADGRSIWEWQTATGVFTQDISDHQLTRLEAPHLELIDAPQNKNAWTSASDRFSRADVTAIARSQQNARKKQAADASLTRGTFHQLVRRLAGAT